MCVYTPLPDQIPELLLAKMDGDGEENDREKTTNGENSGESTSA